MSIRLCSEGRVFLVESFLDKDLWMVGGRTASWDNEENPPIPTGNETEVENPQFAKRITIAYSVYEKDETDFDFELDYKYWKIAHDQESRYANIARYLYMRFIIERNVGPDVEVRQFGVVNNLVPIEGKESNVFLNDYEISSYGELLYLENRRRITRDPANQGEYFEYIMSF